MQFEDLRAFIHIARCGSFSRAASTMCVAQSALSRRMQRLEHSLGIRLLERKFDGVELTPHAQDFYLKAQRLVEDLEALKRNATMGLENPSGEVRIAFAGRTGRMLAPPLVTRCNRETPLLRLQLMEGRVSEVHAWLMSGAADVGLTYNNELAVDFKVVPLFSEPLFMFLSVSLAHELFGGNAPSTFDIESLRTIPLIVSTKPDYIRMLIDRLTARSSVRPNIKYEVDGLYSLRGMVEQGMGGTIFSLSETWLESVARGQLCATPFTTPLINWKLYLAYQQSANPGVARVARIIDEEVEKLLAANTWPNARKTLE